jgi:hypothetical protein
MAQMMRQVDDRVGGRMGMLQYVETKDTWRHATCRANDELLHAHQRHDSTWTTLLQPSHESQTDDDDALHLI